MDGWRNPDALFFLFGLVPLVAALAWSMRSRRRALDRIGPGAARLAAEASPVAAIGRAALLVAGFGLLCLAGARPLEVARSRPAKARGIDVVVALDISKSMLAQDVRPSRLERAKAELGALVERLRGNRFALVAFAGAAFVQCPLTTDVDAAKLFMRALSPADMPVPGTSLSRALTQAIEVLDRVEAKTGARGKAIVLLTDGEGHDEDPLVEAKKAREKGIVIHTVGFGTAGGGPIPEYDEQGRWAGWKKDQGREVLSTLNVDLLRKIAEAAGGQFFHVGPGGAGMADLRGALESLSKGEMEADVLVEYTDRYEYFLFPAFLLFVAEAVLSDRRRRRQREGAKKEETIAKAA
jgi:Ca-activated chloride channel family protein